MKCLKCGAELNDDAIFCAKCGCKLSEIDVTNKQSGNSAQLSSKIARWVALGGCALMIFSLFLPYVKALWIEKALIEGGDGKILAGLIAITGLLILFNLRVPMLIFAGLTTAFSIWKLCVFNDIEYSEYISRGSGFAVLLFSTVIMVAGVLYLLLDRLINHSGNSNTSNVEQAINKNISFNNVHERIREKVKNNVKEFPAVWFIESSGQKEGPYSVVQLTDLFKERKFTADTKCMYKDEETWRSADQIKELEVILKGQDPVNNVISKTTKKIILGTVIAIVAIIVLSKGINYFGKNVFLSADEKESIKNVKDNIDNLGDITINSEKQLKVARESYDALTDKCKKKISNYEVLIAAESSFEAAIIESVENDIDTIRDIEKLNSSDLQVLKDIRNKYDALSTEQKKNVKNYSKLTEAEERVLPLTKANDIAISFMDSIRNFDYDTLIKITDNGSALSGNDFVKRIDIDYVRDVIARGFSIDFQKFGSFSNRYNWALDYDDLDNYTCKTKVDSLAQVFIKLSFQDYDIIEVVWDGNKIKAVISVESQAGMIDVFESDNGLSMQNIADRHLGDYMDKHKTEYNLYAQAGKNSLLYMLELDYYMYVMPDAVQELESELLGLTKPDKKRIQLYMEEKNGDIVITSIDSF